jgi:hypothetical protein
MGSGLSDIKGPRTKASWADALKFSHKDARQIKYKGAHGQEKGTGGLCSDRGTTGQTRRL